MREHRQTLRALKRKEKIGLKLGLRKWEETYSFSNFTFTEFSIFKLL